MAIEVVKDPRTRKEITIVSGVVKGVYFNELKNPKTYSGKTGQSWTPTHSINIIVDDARVSLGLTDKDVLRAKDVDEEYKDVTVGAEVSIVIEEVSEYQGKEQYSSRLSNLTVLKEGHPVVKGGGKEGGATNSGGGRYDNVGAAIGGHLHDAIALFIAGKVVEQDIPKAVRALYSLGEQAKEAAKSGDMDFFDTPYSITEGVGTKPRKEASVETQGPAKKGVSKAKAKKEEPQEEVDDFDFDIDIPF